MINFNFFGYHISDELIIFMGIVFFLGLTFGWFCRKGSVFWIIVGLCLFGTIIDFIVMANIWVMSVSFILGFFVHTGKPLYRKLTK